MGLPPVEAGAVHLTVALALPAMAETPVGAPGTVSVVLRTVNCTEAEEVRPDLLTAVTVAVCVPLMALVLFHVALHGALVTVATVTPSTDQRTDLVEPGTLPVNVTCVPLTVAPAAGDVIVTAAAPAVDGAARSSAVAVATATATSRMHRKPVGKHEEAIGVPLDVGPELEDEEGRPAGSRAPRLVEDSHTQPGSGQAPEVALRRTTLCRPRQVGETISCAALVVLTAALVAAYYSALTGQSDAFEAPPPVGCSRR